MVSAGAAELVREQERFVRALLARVCTGQSLEAQATLLKAGVQAARALLELRTRGYEVSDETIEWCLDQLDEACARMIDLMPADRR